MINGVLHYVLLFTSGQWLRLVPTSCDVFPNAVSTAVQYLSLTFPVDQSWTRYNSLHQLAYFITVFIAVPTSVVTRLMQSPTISNRLGWFGRALNRQKARSLHFIALWWFLLFIMAHVTLFHHRRTRQPQHDVGRGARLLVERLCDLRPGHHADGNRLVAGVALQLASCAAGAEDRRGHEPAVWRRNPVVGREAPARRGGYLAAPLAQWHDAEVG